MNDNPKTSEPVEEKGDPKKVAEEQENPKQHGSEVHKGSEAGGAPGEGRTGTGLGSTDS